MARVITSQLGTKNFKIGFTQPFDQAETTSLLSAIQYKDLSSFFTAYRLQHIRYPGGVVGREYIWDDKLQIGSKVDYLSDDAQQILTAYFGTTNYSTIRNRLSSEYSRFLTFCTKSHTQPIIALNVLFYAFAGVLYPITELNEGTYLSHGIPGMSLQSDRWAKTETYIKAQLAASHAIFPRPIQWELGNENYNILSAADYAEIVINFISYIKPLYPLDRILVSVAKGVAPGSEKDQWNIDLISALSVAGVMDSIDFWVVHYYPCDQSNLSTLTYTQQADIDTRIAMTRFSDTDMARIKATFTAHAPGGYVPKFSLTEFNILDNDTYKNTQTHALIMLDFLMKAKAEPNVISLSHQTGNLINNGMFFQQAQSNILTYNNLRPDSLLFPYVAPQCKIIPIFLANVGTDIVSYLLASDLETLITTGYVMLLNHKDATKVWDSTAYSGKDYTTYTFPDIASKFWYPEDNTSIGTLSTSYTLPAHSFTIIKTI